MRKHNANSIPGEQSAKLEFQHMPAEKSHHPARRQTQVLPATTTTAYYHDDDATPRTTTTTTATAAAAGAAAAATPRTPTLSTEVMMAARVSSGRDSSTLDRLLV